MTKTTCFAMLSAILGLALASPSVLSAKSAPRAASHAAEGPMVGKIALGATAIPGNSGDLNGLTGDFWVSDKVALEGFLGFGSTNPYVGGYDAAGKPVNDSISQFGLEASGRFNVIEVDETVFFNVLGRLS